MKAKEVLRRYQKEGQRNFRGENLRGQSFKGQDLSGADFSEADIRSANFSNAILRGTNFSKAKAGLQRRWAIILVIVSWLIALVSGLFSAFSSFAFLDILVNTGLNNNDKIITILILLVLNLIFFYFTIVEGLVAGIGYSIGAIFVIVVGAVVVALIGAITGAFAGAVVGAVAFTGAIVIAITITGAVAGAGAIVVAGAVAFAVNIAGAVILAIFGAFIFAVAIKGDVVAVTFAVIFVCWPAYISLRAINGDERDAWIRSFAIVFAAFAFGEISFGGKNIAIGGTSFRNADLTDANFIKAKLKSTDLRKATLIRTRWRDAIKLDRVRPGNSYLNNRQIQKLVITENGEGKDFSQLVNLTGINLQGANLIDANFQGSDLSQANLQSANLTDANLIRANLNQAQLQDADLSRAKLVQTQLEATDLTGTILTGAYIEEWGITTATILNGIQCDYVFMRLPTKEKPEPYRKPDDCSKDFGEGEFVDFITPLVQTLDLYHSQGGEPGRIAYAFDQLCEDNPETELGIVSIEKRGKNRQGTLIRVETSDQADNNQLHSDYFKTYDYLDTLSPEAFKALLAEKDKAIQRLEKLVSAAVNKPNNSYNQSGNFGIGSMSDSEIKDNATVAGEINENA